jgi:hypothetical protein
MSGEMMVRSTSATAARRSTGSSLSRTALLAMLMAAAGTLVPMTTLTTMASAQENPVTGQPGAAAPATDASLLDDFAHYVLTANYTMAESVGQELLARKVTNSDFATLVEAGDVRRFESAAQRALRVRDNDGLQATAGGLLKAFEMGRLERARQPKQVAENIKALTGSLRERLLGRQGLIQAGEYAVPQLLEAYLQNGDASLSVQAQSVLIDLGRQSVVPLGTAMLAAPEVQQEKIARVLGLIPYNQSLPYLVDLQSSTRNPAVGAECSKAITRLGGASSDAATLYRQLAESYYAEKDEVTSFQGEEFQLLWGADASTGLAMNAIRTPVFHEALAMRLSERAMQIESTTSGGVNPDTLSLWVASNYSREFDTPEGYKNPAYPTATTAGEGEKARRSAEYFGVAAGSDVAQRVLARALSEKDTKLARKALEAVEQTAGGKVVMDVGSARSPLASALVYPDRRVQLESALAIAAARPTAVFTGSERVVPTLASAVSGLTQQFAAVLALDVERYQSVRGQLEKQGFTVLPQGASLSDLTAPLAEAPAVDLVVIAGYSGDRTSQNIQDIRGFTKTSTSAIVVLAPADVYAGQQTTLESIPGVALRPAGIPEAALAKTVTDLLITTGGSSISSAEASAYAVRSLSALRDLAVAGNPVLKTSEASSVLIGALEGTKPVPVAEIAEVLSLVNSDRAQRALLDGAMKAPESAKVPMLALVASNAKLFGNMLEPRQVDQLFEAASSPDDALATAAAGVLGALSLPNKDLVPLILSK